NMLQSPADHNNIMIATTPNGQVYVRDVSTVVDTYKKVTDVQSTNGKSALGITVLKQSSANTVETADNVKKTIDKLQAQLPPDVKISISEDASVFTRNSLSDVQRELTTAVLLTGLVLLVFLHTFRSTLIVLLAIPSS